MFLNIFGWEVIMRRVTYGWKDVYYAPYEDVSAEDLRKGGSEGASAADCGHYQSPPKLIFRLHKTERNMYHLQPRRSLHPFHQLPIIRIRRRRPRQHFSYRILVFRRNEGERGCVHMLDDPDEDVEPSQSTARGSSFNPPLAKNRMNSRSEVVQ